MIEPQFLSFLRQQYRAEMVLVMVQIEQICPCWHQSIADLALQLGTDRATLNRSLSHLMQHGLIKYHSVAKGGCWIWWVKRSSSDAPNPKDEPGWDLRILTNYKTIRIPISKRQQWAKDRGIPYATLNGFLLGRQTVLRNRWRVIRSPFDIEDMEV